MYCDEATENDPDIQNVTPKLVSCMTSLHHSHRGILAQELVSGQQT